MRMNPGSNNFLMVIGQGRLEKERGYKRLKLAHQIKLLFGQKGQKISVILWMRLIWKQAEPGETGRDK